MTTDNNRFYGELYDGLTALAESAFPKKCSGCGRVFDSAEQFLRETRDITCDTSGLKEAVDDDGGRIVELFRNCPCGSTLMDFFSDRRDMSAQGISRRQRFEQLLYFLQDRDIPRAVARQELLKVMHGEKSEILSRIRPPPKK